MKNWIASWAASALALFIITKIGIGVKADTVAAGAIFIVLLSLVNSFIRPVVMFFAMPINCLTLGLFGFVINAAIFMLVGNSIGGFHVLNLFSAMIGSVLMGLLSGAFGFVLQDKKA